MINGHGERLPADQFLVRLLANGIVWTGAIISESGEILTTSQTLGNAPVVDIELGGGTHGQACVIGRDDSIGLALLKPLSEPRTYQFADLSATVPALGDQLGLAQHSASSPHVSKWVITVSGYREGDPGYAYFGIQAGDTPADGAMVMNAHAEVQGIHMPTMWLLQHEVGNPGEVWAIDVPQVVNTALPILRSGRMHIEPIPRVWNYPPDAWNALYLGTVTLDGAPPPVGTTLHVRLSKAGQPDHWDSTTLDEDGFFFMEILVVDFQGAAMEFWVDCRLSATTATFEYNFFNPLRLNLAF